MSKEFEDLLGQYWDLAHLEGKSGVSQGDKANEVLHALKKLAEQPAQQEPVHEFAYKAITKHGHHCHFGTHEAARSWAGEGGEVETIKLRHFELVKTTDTSSQPAQPQQEPVAWAISYDGKTPYFLWTDGDGVFLDLEVKRQGGTTCKLPLYTSPPAQRKPLTDYEIANILPDDDSPMSLGEAFVKFARAIERAHGIKENT